MICKMGIYLSIVDDRVIDARLSKTFTNITQMLNTTCQVAVKGRFVCIDVVCHNYNMNIGCKDTQKNGLDDSVCYFLYILERNSQQSLIGYILC